MGADHVVVGTNYPYDMGGTDVVGPVKGMTSLSGSARSAILSGTAAQLLRIHT